MVWSSSVSVDKDVDNFGDLSTGAFTIRYAFERWRLPRLAPSDELQGRHAGRRFSSSSEPPSDTAMMWSAVVAIRVQHSSPIAQSGPSCSSSFRLAL